MSKLRFRDVTTREYTRPDGYVCSIDEDGNGVFHVDMWKPDGENHWSKQFRELEDALDEFRRWRN